MEYLLGIITGLIIAILIAVVAVRNQAGINRTLNRTVSAIRKKGEILEPENEDIKNWTESLKTE